MEQNLTQEQAKEMAQFQHDPRPDIPPIAATTPEPLPAGATPGSMAGPEANTAMADGPYREPLDPMHTPGLELWQPRYRVLDIAVPPGQETYKP